MRLLLIATSLIALAATPALAADAVASTTAKPELGPVRL